ncbi:MULTISPECIES: oxidoreductase [Actinomadura]|uniref:Oxidoreductase n=1 Tax=Actinomadura yumaensis TaxID=111807 RepID=A0ABW2CIP5_9ACTN|nr:oxidoreductase [Actinomadura sp. J1-007]MWK39989.1 SDR family NAD(P)-dependent oxidoreductase [Actinomadura sp. J1-007]
MPLAWFITGASSGFGRAVAAAAAERGDRVLATARRASTLDGLVRRYPDRVRAAEVDVTDPGSVRAAVELAVADGGRIDVVVNNAGYAVLGALEELTDDQARRQVDVNLFGALTVTRAVLPVLRAQRGGHLLQMSSISGAQPWVGFSLYVATKHAVEGFSSSLAGEVAHLGIKVTIVEPGPFKTDFFTRSMVRSLPSPDYAESVGQTRAFMESFTRQPGDPDRAAQAILAVVDDDKPPLRLPLGAYAVEEFRAEYRSRLNEIDAWEDLARGTDYPVETP